MQTQCGGGGEDLHVGWSLFERVWKISDGAENLAAPLLLLLRLLSSVCTRIRPNAEAVRGSPSLSLLS